MRGAGHVVRMGEEEECIYDFGWKSRRKETIKDVNVGKIILK
jgi:hypothetical protein